MKINETRKVQQVPNKNTLIVCIPKIIVALLGLSKGNKLKFANEGNRIYIEKES